MSLQMIVLKGLPASGKSTWAKAIQVAHPGDYNRTNRDEIRAMFNNNHWNKASEKIVQNLEEQMIRTSLTSRQNIIVDNTHLKPSHILRLQLIAEEYNAEFVLKDFTDIPLDVCIARDKERGSKSVGQKVIRRMYSQFLAEILDPPVYNFDLPDCMICDLDGTLALFDGLRSPYDGGKCHVDTLCTEVAEILHNARLYNNRKIIFITGCPDTFRMEREAWLKEHGVIYDALYMRLEGDRRPDYITKREIYEQEIKGRYNVHTVLEDRTQVVDMWRSLGLVTFQVRPGDF